MLSEDVGLCVDQRSFLPCQLPGLVPLQIPYGCTCDQYDRSHRSNGPTCNPLQARGANLGCLYLSDLRLLALKLRAFIPKPLRFGFLAGTDQGALSVGNLVCRRLPGSYPYLRGVEVVAAQQQRFRVPAPVPPRREFPEPRVFANPVEVNSQGLREL